MHKRNCFRIRSMAAMMKLLVLAFCASFLILFATAVPSVQTKARAVGSNRHICEIIGGPTKALYTGEKPQGWKDADFDDGSWTDVTFPLADEIGCSYLEGYGTPGGPFPENQRIITRNKFTLKEIPDTARISIMAGSFARVFVNGVLVYTTPVSNTCKEASHIYVLHLFKDNSPFVIGENVVAVNAQNNGGQSFLNLGLDFIQTIPCEGQQLNVDLSPDSYNEEDYYECEVIGGPTKALFTDEKPRGWKERDFNDESWTEASFPLAENVVCPQMQAFGPPGGPFPTNTRIVTRNTFFIPDHPSSDFFAVIKIVADNKAKIFVNGIQVFETPDVTSCASAATVHEVQLPLDLSMPLVIGENVVSVNAQDTGGQSFLDVKMVIGGAQPCDTF